MMRHPTPRAALLAALLFLPAWACIPGECDIYELECVADADTESPEAGEEQGADGACEGQIEHAQIDASDIDVWVYLDLDTCAGVEASEGWELGLQRFSIVINGGISGDAGVEASWIEGLSLEDIDAVPSDAQWRTDALDADDDGEDELVFGDWYDYDIATHVLTPKPRVYVVRSTAGVAFAIELEDYYSEAGSSGHLSLRWKALSD